MTTVATVPTSSAAGVIAMPAATMPALASVTATTAAAMQAWATVPTAGLAGVTATAATATAMPALGVGLQRGQCQHHSGRCRQRHDQTRFDEKHQEFFLPACNLNLFRYFSLCWHPKATPRNRRQASDRQIRRLYDITQRRR
jgi:hypothetical protein